jgi:hypothetical protein
MSRSSNGAAATTSSALAPAGMTPRTIEVLDQRGIADRFLSHGATGQNGHYSGIFFDVADLPTRHNYGPIREHYLGAEPGHFARFDRTEICWPIFSTGRVTTTPLVEDPLRE